MKSHGGLWARIVAPENLRAAWRRVRRGHAHSPEVVAFEADLEAHLAGLRTDLLAGTYRPGAYRQFRVRDPKPRTISCAPVRDRVVHHALCGVIAPLLERGFTEDSYACREGKGTHRACARARDLVRRHPWFCKIDVRHYFDAVSHDRLLALLQPKFREGAVQELIERTVRHPVPGCAAGRGLPIGNLTSQWFANAFLDGFDHFAKEKLGLPGYIRYMDDMVFFAESKAEGWRARDEAERWLRAERGLELKSEATRVAPVSEGLPFLGLRIFPAVWRLQRSRFLRTRRTFARRVRECRDGALDEARLQACAVSADGGVRWFGFKGILKDVEDRAFGEGAVSGSNRVKRGGSWNNNARNCRSANRNNTTPDNRNNNLGFRPASTVPPGPAGSHPERPASRERGNEQIPPRAAGSASERRAGAVFVQNRVAIPRMEASGGVVCAGVGDGLYGAC